MMKGLVKWGRGKDKMGIREVPEPTVGPDDLLVEVGAVGICGSDLHIWRDEKKHKEPVVLGHEYSGVVVEKGSGVREEWQIGDRICSGLETTDGRIGTDINGAYAPLLSIPKRLAHPLPDNFSFEEGGLIELVTSAGYSAMYRTRLWPGDFVVITGPGPFGLTMLQMVKLFSPRVVVVTGLKSDTKRLAKAKELGADYTFYSEEDPVEEVMRLTDGQGADVCIDASGGEAAIGQCLRMTRVGGWVTIVGLWGYDFKTNLDMIPYNNLTVRGGWGWAGYEYDDQMVRLALDKYPWKRALQIMAMGKTNQLPLITRRITMEEWRDAFEALERTEEIKVIMYPNEKYMPK